MKWDRIAKIRFEKILWKLSHLGGGGISMFTFLKRKNRNRIDALKSW